MDFVPNTFFGGFLSGVATMTLIALIVLVSVVLVVRPGSDPES